MKEGIPIMRLAPGYALTLLACVRLLFSTPPVDAAINALGLGASYDSAHSNVIFRVYSSRATRIEVDLYAVPMGSPEVLRTTLSANNTSNIFSGSIPVTTLQAAGITGTVYYGYRAWGPNWPFSDTWTKGSSDGFISDVDAQGNRFNPNKLLIDPYAHEISHDPINATWTDGTVYASGPSYATSTAATLRLRVSFGRQPARATAPTRRARRRTTLSMK
jgi:glycogen operon protein